MDNKNPFIMFSMVYRKWQTIAENEEIEDNLMWNENSNRVSTLIISYQTTQTT